MNITYDFGGTAGTREMDCRSDFPTWGYSLDARQVFGAAAAGYCFGGMGWWNDQTFADPVVNERYQVLTEVLYVALIDALGASVNSFDPTIQPI